MPKTAKDSLYLVDSLWQDVRYALRGLRRSPGFTFVALLVLAFGIAANTTVFSVINAVLLRPLPVSQPEHLRFLRVVFPGFTSPHGVPFRTFQQLAQRRHVFSGVAGFSAENAKFGGGTSATLLAGERVTTEYFDVLGVHAAIGRTFVAADDVPGADPVVVISNHFWRTRLDANPHVLGTTIDLRSVYTSSGTYMRHHRVYTVIGVMPPGFNGVSTVWIPRDYWVPLRQRANDLAETLAETSGGGGDITDEMDFLMRTTIVARPLRGVSEGMLRGAVFSAEQDMLPTTFATAHGLREERGRIVTDRSIEGRLPFDPTGRVVPERLALALMIVPLLVVLIAASNLAGILMARGVARRGEVGVRLALGASRARVARQMLTESLLLSLAGAAMAVLMSRAFIELFSAYLPRMGRVGVYLTAISLEVPLDARVLVFTIALAAGTGLVLGMTPAIQSRRTDVLGALVSGGNALGVSRRARHRRWIVVPQISLSLVLLLAAGVLVRGLLRAEFGDRGFDPNGVVYAEVATPLRYRADMTPQQREAEHAQRTAEYRQLLEQIRRLPGVEAAALANEIVWTGQDNVPVVTRESYRDGQERWAAGAQVSSGYFATMKIPIVRGRPFDEHDTRASTPVAIVSEDLAHSLWPDRDALGEYVASPDGATTAPPTWRRVVGITETVELAGDEDSARPFLYLPIEQLPFVLSASVVARGRRNAPDLLKMLPAAIVAAQPDAEVPRARTMNDEIGEALYPKRLGAVVLTVSGVFGLLLSMVGLYGVVSYSTAQRMREIGIRCALGASRRALVALLLRDAVMASAVAVGTGVVLGMAAVRVVSSIVIALPGPDIISLIGIPLLFSAVMLAACVRPARRAARINPIDVLRAP
ncbi:MAG TPA: ADOP family duplicated permease [Vicinamibacterales bacterium]|nr:ADOP family duplicated permease [Vicinamibacterales bacterium]